MARKALTLIAQLSDLPQLRLVQRRPPSEEDRHARIASVAGSPKLVAVER